LLLLLLGNRLLRELLRLRLLVAGVILVLVVDLVIATIILVSAILLLLAVLRVATAILLESLTGNKSSSAGLKRSGSGLEGWGMSLKAWWCVGIQIHSLGLDLNSRVRLFSWYIEQEMRPTCLESSSSQFSGVWLAMLNASRNLKYRRSNKAVRGNGGKGIKQSRERKRQRRGV
jgi:hypothetical protein